MATILVKAGRAPYYGIDQGYNESFDDTFFKSFKHINLTNRFSSMVARIVYFYYFTNPQNNFLFSL